MVKAIGGRGRRPARRTVDVGLPVDQRPDRAVVRRSGTWTLQATLDRYGLSPVAGVDEAGRGACAGPLVVAACVLRTGDAKRLVGLTDSKLLSPTARDEFYALLLRRAVEHAVVVIDPVEVDRRGVHVANIEGMRRAVARLVQRPGYVLTDGFAVRGLGSPALAVPKGDQVAACVAAASVLAKVTRDRIMEVLDREYPQYGFAEHKGYCTSAHGAALAEHGPSPVHRHSFVNVRARLDLGVGLDVGIGVDEMSPVPGPVSGLVHNECPATALAEVAVGGGWGR